MSRNDSPLIVSKEEVYRLAMAVIEDDVSDAEAQRFESLIATNPAARSWYVDLICDTCALQRLNHSQVGRTDLPNKNGTVHAISPAPVSGFLSHATHGVFFSSGWPVAYLVATVILGVGLIIGAITHVSHPAKIVKNSPPIAVEHGSASQSRAADFVGQITGMVDCKWASGLPSPASGGHHEVVGAGGEGSLQLRSPVRLHNRFALASGLLEITYDTGAKVILQGPVSFEVESINGGFLSVGKLTGKVEVEKAKGFSVRTPTARVTDLGTEFGVEVGKEGHTTAHVYRGSVRVQLLRADAEKEGSSIVLHANESAQTQKAGDRSIAINRVNVAPKTFVRRMARTPKTLDLLDIVAGGYGTTGLRERGIDPIDGMEDTWFSTERRYGDGKYHPIDWHKFIDGVFMPDGRTGPVVVDSAGHTFDGFPKTERMTDASIWARAASIRTDGQEKNEQYWMHAIGPGRQYMPNGTGLLGLTSQKGITFNLGAMRARYQGVRPIRFRAVVAVADARGLRFPNAVQEADVWVLVDGRPRLSLPHFRPQDGLVKVNVELGPQDRFLTLASTYGGNVRNLDWVVFGDPVLEMAGEAERESPSDSREALR